MDLHSNFSISLKILVFLSKEKNKDQCLSYFNILTNRDPLYNLTENCLQFFLSYLSVYNFYDFQILYFH